MNLVNIHATKNEVYLFLREQQNKDINSGKLDIIIDDNFYPYRYIEHPNGVFKTYDGKKVKKVYGDLYRIGKIVSYENDVNFTRQYLLDKVEKIDKTFIRYVFIDIEILIDNNKTFDEIILNASSPISCITLYDNLKKEYYSFFLLDYKGKDLKIKESKLLNDFITTITKIKPDLLLAWNIKFDYNYLFKRIRYLNFAELISPVSLTRWSGMEGIDFPVGISVLDYMEMYRKYTQNKANSYTLDNVLKEEIGKGKKHANMNFSILTKELKERNKEDVEGLVKLEKKLNLIEYYDALRRISKCLWEDLPSKTYKKDGKYVFFSNNSKIIDMLCLQEARKMGIVLPNKPKNKEMKKKESFEGGFRKAFVKGIITNPVQKLDLTSAYPNSLVDFCLDSTNIKEKPNENTIEINGIYFEQNSNALLPRVGRKLLDFKAKIKNKLKNIVPDSEEYKQQEQVYASIKGVVNSLFGVIGLQTFRLFDIRIPATITFLVRDLLAFVINELSKEGYKIVYVDTDSVMVETEEDLLDKCNNFVSRWAKERYKKENISIEFEKEGVFEKLFVIAKCRYIGILNTKKGKKTEIKGVEVKRKDSSVFLKKFQKEMFDFLFDLEELGLSKEEKERKTGEWLQTQINKFLKENLINISFPVRYINKKYKNLPIFLRALKNSIRKQKEFENYVINNNLYYYIYDRKDGVIAFAEGWEHLINEIDWYKMIERNILNKAKVIYEVLDYDLNKVIFDFSKNYPEQAKKIGLFIDSKQIDLL